MKKLSILLIGLMLVAGIAFADFGDVKVTGSASVTWGIDLNTMATGFANAGTSGVTLTLIDKATAETTGDDAVFGKITVKDYSLSVADGVISSALGSVSASIFVDPATITIWSAPGMSWGNATIIDGTDLGVALASAQGNTIGGVGINLPIDPIAFDLYVVSDGDWTNNAANLYAVGADVELKVDPVTLDLGGFYGWFGAATWGATAAVDLAIDPIDVAVGFDIVPGDWEVSGAFDVDLSEANADDKTANVGVDVSYSTADDLDVALAFTEPEAGGLADMLYATLAVELINFTGGLGWNVDVDGGYDTGDLDPYFNFGYGSDMVFDLNVGVALKSGLTGIDNTTITIDYVSTNLSTDLGIITVEAAISL